MKTNIESPDILNRINTIKTYLLNNGVREDIKLFNFAVDDLSEEFSGLLRKSGKPLMLHSVRVAEMLVKVEQAPKIVIAGLIHDLQEDSTLTNADIEFRYGQWIADVVEALSKETRQKDTHDKWISAGMKEPGIILIKLFDRLDNLRELSFLSSQKQKRIRKETSSVYLPLSDVLPQSVALNQVFQSIKYLV